MRTHEAMVLEEVLGTSVSLVDGEGATAVGEGDQVTVGVEKA